jgi:DmsE family decaheme c-type cytochrome
MIITSPFGIGRMLGILGAALLLLLAGIQPLAAQPAPGKASPEETCKACHAPYFEGYLASKHSTKGDLRAPANMGGCLACHGDGALEHAAKGGGKGVGGLVGFGDPKLPAETKSAVCLTCHQGGERVNWHVSSHASRDVACSSCHTVHARDKVQVKSEQFEVCANCHKTQRAQLSYPSRHPIREGQVACSQCHNPHGSTGPTMLVKGTVNETCYTCHAEKRGPFLWEHAPVREDCTACHTPHGSVNAPLLKARGPWLCQQCHSAQMHPSTLYSGRGLPPSQGGVAAAQQVLARNCMNCHTQVHGSNHPSGPRLTR